MAINATGLVVFFSHFKAFRAITGHFIACLTEKNMEERWLSVDEIAAYLGIKRDTVYKWIAEKDMPAHRVGRLWKFQRNEIDIWVRQGKTSERNNDNN